MLNTTLGHGIAFLIAAGLESISHQNFFSKMTDAELLDIVKSEVTRIGSAIAKDYNENRSNYAPSRYYLEKKLGLTWTQILQRIGFKPNVRHFTDEQLIQGLKDLSIDLGKTPTTMEARDAGLNISLYDVRFGGYNNALKLARLDVNSQNSEVIHSDDELLLMYEELCTKLDKPATAEDIDHYLSYRATVFELRFGSINNLRELSGYERYEKKTKYSKANISKVLTKKYIEYGRRLTNKEINILSANNKNFPCTMTICRHFRTTKMSDVWDEIEKTSTKTLEGNNSF